MRQTCPTHPSHPVVLLSVPTQTTRLTHGSGTGTQHSLMLFLKPNSAPGGTQGFFTGQSQEPKSGSLGMGSLNTCHSHQAGKDQPRPLWGLVSKKRVPRFFVSTRWKIRMHPAWATCQSFKRISTLEQDGVLSFCG